MKVCWRRQTHTRRRSDWLGGPSQWIWGEQAAYTRETTWKHMAVGLVIHCGSSIFWALFYEQLFGRNHRELQRVSKARILAEAGLLTGVAYFVDYHVAPKRLQPGFKKASWRVIDIRKLCRLRGEFGAAERLAQESREPQRP